MSFLCCSETGTVPEQYTNSDLSESIMDEEAVS